MGPIVAAPKVKQVRALTCPNCGGTVELRGFGASLNAVCGSCLSVLDAQSEHSIMILQKFSGKMQQINPLIPLGTRGTLRGQAWDMIGWQRRAIVADGQTYAWFEYLLFHPYRGYRYLTEYDGHWNLISPVAALPVETTVMASRTVKYGGRTYKHFQNAVARTTFVMGEFPYQVRVGETVTTDDFCAPPFGLSCETTKDEQTWSLGEYIDGSEIWRAFQLAGSPPRARGVYFNQPNPYVGRPGFYWKAFLVLAALWLFLLTSMALFSRSTQVFADSYVFDPQVKSEAAFVTPTFELTGRPADVDIKVESDVNQQELDLYFALINNDTGVAFNKRKTLSYYYGSDSDGPWTEGDRKGTATFSGVPAGSYYLRVEPDADDKLDGGLPAPQIRYSLQVKRGGMGLGWMLLGFLLLLIPPFGATISYGSFESKRWAESDTGGSSGDDGDDD